MMFSTRMLHEMCWPEGLSVSKLKSTRNVFKTIAHWSLKKLLSWIWIKLIDCDFPRYTLHCAREKKTRLSHQLKFTKKKIIFFKVMFLGVTNFVSHKIIDKTVKLFSQWNVTTHSKVPQNKPKLMSIELKLYT